MAGLESVTYQTFIGERMHPLDQASEEFIDVQLDFWGNLALGLDIPEADKAQWKRLLDRDSEDYLRKDPNFYWRETWGLVIGYVP